MKFNKIIAIIRNVFMFQQLRAIAVIIEGGTPSSQTALATLITVALNSAGLPATRVVSTADYDQLQTAKGQIYIFTSNLASRASVDTAFTSIPVKIVSLPAWLDRLLSFFTDRMCYISLTEINGYGAKFL